MLAVRENVPDAFNAEPAHSNYNFVTLRVDTDRAASTRQCLHACLGDLIEIYTVSNETHLGRSTFQIKTRHCPIDYLMHQIMSCLPEAEFGQIHDRTERVIH